MDRAVWTAYPKVPAISRGRKTREGLLCVGFSYPVRREGRRYRIASFVSEDQVISALSPWEVLGYAYKKNALTKRIHAVSEIAHRSKLRLGIFGASALELVTGLPYLYAGSDLDLVIDAAGEELLNKFYVDLAAWEAESGIQADVELRLGSNCCCKLKELMSKQCSILCKGEAEPFLLSRRSIQESLKSADKNIK